MKKAENSENVHFLQALAEHIDQVIFAYQLDAHQFTYLNPAFEQVWQQNRKSIMADPVILLDTIHPEDQIFVRQTYQELIHGVSPNHGDRRPGDHKVLEFRIQLPGQPQRWICLTPFLLKEENGLQLIAGFAEDITRSKDHEETLNKFSAKKNSILEILSHDLARPLANIQSLSTLLANRLKSYGEEELEELVNKIKQTSEQGIRLIRDFIQEEFLASAQAALVKKRLDIVEKLRIIIDQYQDSEKEIHKTFQLFTSSDVIYCEIDEPKFAQAINNLISNAIKFTPDEGVITVRIEQQPGHILITVEDNGIGIPAHLQEGLFEKFPKARRPGLKGEPSTGLGMSIIKMIVEWHNGKIWFESEENKGTIVYIELPEKS